MRGLYTILPAAAMTLLSGCAGVVSLHPLVLPNSEDAVFEPALVGVWQEVVKPEEAPGTKYTIARAESGYSVTVAPEQKGTMHVLKKDGRYLLDVYCPSPGVPPPAHLFLRLRLEKDTAWVADLDRLRVLEYLRHNGRVRYETLPDDHDRIVLTSSSDELRQLLPYLLTDQAFGGETMLRRIE